MLSLYVYIVNMISVTERSLQGLKLVNLYECLQIHIVFMQVTGPYHPFFIFLSVRHNQEWI